MPQTDTQFTARIAATPQTQKKLAILAAVNYEGFRVKGKLLEYLVNDAWMDAKSGGLVTDAMLKQRDGTHAAT